MIQTSQVTVEHVVVQSNRLYDEVKAASEERMGVLENTDEPGRQLASMNPPWDQVTKVIEERLGPSGFSIFRKVEQAQLLSLLGNPCKAIHYAVGNPLLANQMIAHFPEAALYAPLRSAAQLLVQFTRSCFRSLIFVLDLKIIRWEERGRVAEKATVATAPPIVESPTDAAPV
jgi:hypothetical protein